MRSHRRRTPLQHVLLAGTAADLSDIGSVLAMLPPDSYGQVIIEGDVGSDTLADLPTPARVMTHRVADGSARNAVAAWAAEWKPSESDADREVSIWIADSSSAQSLAVELGSGAFTR